MQQSVRSSTAINELHPYCSANNCPYKFQPEYVKTPQDGDVPPILQPTEIELDMPNTWCNIGGPIPTPERPACFMCPRSGIGFHPDDEVYDQVLESIRPLVPHLERFMLVGLGEIFWKDNLWNIFDKIGYEPYKDQIEFGSFSNGICLDERRIKRFLESCPKFFLNISIDAATPETYCKLRRLNCYDKVIENTKRLILHPDRNPETQHVSPCYNINLLNIDEVRQMAIMWKGMPVSSILFSATHDCFATYDNGLESITVNEHNYKRFVRARELLKSLETRLPIRIWNKLEMDFEIKALEQKERLERLKTIKM